MRKPTLEYPHPHIEKSSAAKNRRVILPSQARVFTSQLTRVALRMVSGYKLQRMISAGALRFMFGSRTRRCVQRKLTAGHNLSNIPCCSDLEHTERLLTAALQLAGFGAFTRSKPVHLCARLQRNNSRIDGEGRVHGPCLSVGVHPSMTLKLQATKPHHLSRLRHRCC